MFYLIRGVTFEDLDAIKGGRVCCLCFSLKPNGGQTEVTLNADSHGTILYSISPILVLFVLARAANYLRPILHSATWHTQAMISFVTVVERLDCCPLRQRATFCQSVDLH